MKRLAAFALGLAACAPSYQVLYHSAARPLRGQRLFAVERLRFESTMVGRLSDREWTERKSEASRARYQADKARWSEDFAFRLAARAAPLRVQPELDGEQRVAGGGFTIRPSVTFLEPGFYAGFTAEDTQIDLTVQVLAPDGRVVDEVALRESVPAHFWDPGRGTRIRKAIDRLADRYADYLLRRTSAG